MLLYTNNANNVFDFVDEKFGNRDISPAVFAGKPVSHPQEFCVVGEILAAVVRQVQAANAA
ncbi:hypothetical protein [Pseudomonas silesiensis]|uniref:hypothetical protein n=1 Tax=Pseudomonas silesiensis TaxID=1853130 RepID=UPI0034D75F48